MHLLCPRNFTSRNLSYILAHVQNDISTRLSIAAPFMIAKDGKPQNNQIMAFPYNGFLYRCLKRRQLYIIWYESISKIFQKAKDKTVCICHTWCKDKHKKYLFYMHRISLEYCIRNWYQWLLPGREIGQLENRVEGRLIFIDQILFTF